MEGSARGAGAILGLMALMVAGGAGCAATRPAQTTTTAADVAPAAEGVAPAAADTAPAAPAADAPAAPALAPPAGDLACRTHSPVNTVEIYVQWEPDGTGHGTIRTTDTEGRILSEMVKAERYKARIVIDRPGSTDLVEHLATVLDENGKKRIQRGNYGAPWAPCD